MTETSLADHLLTAYAAQRAGSVLPLHSMADVLTATKLGCALMLEAPIQRLTLGDLLVAPRPARAWPGQCDAYASDRARAFSVFVSRGEAKTRIAKVAANGKSVPADLNTPMASYFAEIPGTADEFGSLWQVTIRAGKQVRTFIADAFPLDFAQEA